MVSDKIKLRNGICTHFQQPQGLLSWLYRMLEWVGRELTIVALAFDEESKVAVLLWSVNNGAVAT